MIEAAASRNVEFTLFFALNVENRRSEKTNSTILWPSHLSQGDAFNWYVEQLPPNTQFELRTLPSRSSTRFFSSEARREVVEQAFLDAGSEIYRFPTQRDARMRPLGYSRFDGFGFGTLAATYLNCPNNAPLALWWGNATGVGTLGRWYPLMERRVRAG